MVQIDGILKTWAPFILERMINLVDVDLVREVLNQTIERIKERVEETDTEWDDRIVLPLLEILKLVIEEKDER
jgi:hypothetical protein